MLQVSALAGFRHPKCVGGLKPKVGVFSGRRPLAWSGLRVRSGGSRYEEAIGVILGVYGQVLTEEGVITDGPIPVCRV